MKAIFALIFAFLGVRLSADPWVYGISFASDGLLRPWELATDANSNIFLTGEFEGNLYLEEQIFPGMGASDTFLAKFDEQGTLLWCQTLISDFENAGLGVGTDAWGNSYLGGYYSGTIYCQGDSLVSNGMWDAYVAKFDPQGALQWLQGFGGEMNDIFHGLAVIPSGQVFAGGWFADAILLEDETLQSYGGSDAMVISLDTHGNLLWARHGGGPGVEYGYKISCDNAGNSYLTGWGSAGSTFGEHILESHGMYVAKYDNVGTAQWLLSSDNAQVISISVQDHTSPQQKGAVSGRLSGSGSIGDFPFEVTDSINDFYWAEFDASSGIWLSLEQHGGSGDDRGRDCDFAEHLVVVGSLSESIVFMDNEYQSAGGQDILFYDSLSGVLTAGGPEDEIAYAICRLPNGSIALAGWHFGSFNLGGFTLDSGSASSQNGFLAIYDPASSIQTAVQGSIAHHCYPNPFNPHITISYVLAQSGAIDLAIYDLRGRRVLTLEHGAKSAGAHESRWDGRDESGKALPSGMYLYLLQSPLSTVYGKMILLK